MALSLFLCLWTLAFTRLVAAVCECGYRTNTQDYWQYSIETSFNTTTTAQFRQSSDWLIDSIVYGESPSRHTATNYTTANVNVANKTLQLTCSAYNSTVTDSQLSAQIHTVRDDIKYGSFRAKFSISGNGTGVVGALFFYANDTQETDIELLTSDNVRNARFTNQPDSTQQIYLPNGLKRTDLTDYRIDWNRLNTKYYANNVLSSTLTKNVPTTNGSIYLNAWGGSNFAGPSPTSDVTMSVSSISLYFNTSDASLASSWNKLCLQAKTKVCDVDSQALQQNTTTASRASNKPKKNIRGLAATALAAPIWLWGA